MNKLAELEMDQSMGERLEERPFIEWMIESLERKQLAVLLVAVDNKLINTAVDKLPKAFIQNKLLLKSARRRLKQIKIMPPFHFMLTVKKDESEAEELIHLAEEHNCDNRQIALILFLQNHYEQALERYDQREDYTEKDNEREASEKDVNPEAEIEGEQQLSPKVEKRLQQKIQILTNEKTNLIEQMKKLKEDLKEKNRAYQNEMNQLRQELSQINGLNEDILKENEVLKEKVEKNRLATSPLKKKNKEKSKVAFIGNPMNSAIISSEKFQIDVYELSMLQDFVKDWMEYKHVIYLSYTLDEVTFEASIPAAIREEIITVDRFMTLKKMMGDL